MRIDRIEIENFKKYRRLDLCLNPQFTLLVGENGSGKTTVLDALAVAAGIWLAEPPDSNLANSGRSILPSWIRLESKPIGDRTQFVEHTPVRVRAVGSLVDGSNNEWTRQIPSGRKRTRNIDAKQALALIKSEFERAKIEDGVILPILAYYGAGRAWTASNDRSRRKKAPRRWDAYYDCFEGRIRRMELIDWFRRETTAAGVRGGKMRPGFDVVRQAILGCVPGADGAWFDPDRDQIVLSISGNAQPFFNLSDGQRLMLELVADLAIKMVTLNTSLLPADGNGMAAAAPRVLTETPGLVLIDELDLHLHPKWQRRVESDLKRTFPKVQFVCTSHSPQVIGQAQPNELRILSEDGVITSTQSFGMDSNLILEEIMGAARRDPATAELLGDIAKKIERQNWSEAEQLLARAEQQLGPDDPAITRSRALMLFVASSPHADNSEKR